MPGQAGSTLIAGHIDDNGVAGAFLRLNEVPLAATVALSTADGRTLHYTITGRFSIPKTTLAASGLLARTGPSRLVLVTCGGSYDARRHLYQDNIVLVASPSPAPGAAR
jgi:sortase (surface protein transpeptidase)